MFPLLEIRRTEARRILHLAGELDLSTSDSLEEALREELGDPGDLVLDLSALTFVDSTGLGVFLDSASRLVGRGALVLRAVRPEVMRTLKVAGIDGGMENLVIVPAQPEHQSE